MLSILIVLFLVLLAATVFVVNNQSQKLHKEIPANIIQYNREALNLRQYTDKPFIVYFVDPECDACAIEMKQLSKKIDMILNKYYLLFLTVKEEVDIVSYLNQLHIYPRTGVFVGIDQSFKVWDYYSIEHVPTMLILDKNFVARKKLRSLKQLLDVL